MSMIGLDPVAMDRLAHRLVDDADLLHETVTTLTSELDAVEWRGPDADAFRQMWAGEHTSTLRDIAEDLIVKAEQVRRERDAQDRASRG